MPQVNIVNDTFQYIEAGGRTLSAQFKVNKNRKSITMNNGEEKHEFKEGQEKHEIVRGIVTLWYLNKRIEKHTYDTIINMSGAIKDLLSSQLKKQ